MSDKPNRPVIALNGGKLRGKKRPPTPDSFEAKLEQSAWDALNPKQQSEVLRQICLSLLKGSS